MRFFRIPAFTGIETHRDDADRGSLRVVEGCVPHGPGGLRSGPVWKKVGDVDLFSSSDQNHMTAGDDGKGNSVVYISRTDEVHDIAVFSTEHTELVSLGASYNVAAPTPYRSSDAVITPIGNRLYAMGDGTVEAAYIGKGPPTATASVFPDEMLYDQEWSRFPNCKFYTQGPRKTIFAAGNPDKPLTVYVSEPAGLTNPYRDSPHSTELTNHNPGVLSTVDILSSNASKITALSTRGDQVVVHTDKGCHLLYSPKADQAETGYRVEQVPATNFSGAVNSQVVSGESGSQHFWMGHDGQIYKDEAASRGAEDFKNYADAAQANWKAKGQWEKEHPVDLSDAFATYDPQSGMYWVYTRSDEYDHSLSGLVPEFPLNLQSSVIPDAPSAPENLGSLISTPSAPGIPINLDSIASAGIPLNLQSSFIPDAPTAPTVLNSTLTPDAPGIPQSLTSEILVAPGTPQSLSSSVIPNSPGAPQSLSSAITAIDAPGAPQNLSSSITAVDAPGSPQSLSSSVTPDAPGVPGNLLSTVAGGALHTSWRNGTSIKILATDWVGATLNSGLSFMGYAGLRNTSNIIASPGTSGWTKWDPMLLSTGPTEPAWMQTVNIGGLNHEVWLVADPGGAQYYLYWWYGSPSNWNGALAGFTSLFDLNLLNSGTISRTINVNNQVGFQRNLLLSL